MGNKIIEIAVRAIRDDLHFLVRIVRNRMYSLIVFLLMIIGACVYYYTPSTSSPRDVLQSLGLFIVIDTTLIITGWPFRKTSLTDIISLTRISVVITTAFLIAFAAKYRMILF